MAHPDEPQRPLSASAGDAAPAQSAHAPVSIDSRFARQAIVAAGVGVAAFVILFAAYLAVAVPGRWIARAPEHAWKASELTLAGGTGALVDGALEITSTGANNTALVTLNTDIRSADYPGIEWVVKGLPEGADVRLLWRTDVASRRTNLANGAVEAGELRTFVLAHDPAWIGRITGLALAVRAPLAAPVRIERVVARPLGALDIARDRWSEWARFEAFNGASINTITGGADAQDLPLPAFAAVTGALAALLLLGLHRVAPRAYAFGIACTLAGVFVVAWFAVDARWALNLARQTRVTYDRYAGKSLEQKHLAAEDGELDAFIVKALALMPSTPARVFVAAGEHYFRGRAAYHLYPHNVKFEAFRDTIAPAAWMKPGDWLLVYHRPGVQYDRAKQSLRWDNGPPVNADLKLIEAHGAALFLIR
ncbi:MAG: hypothetical protein ABI881_15965 [Betaproteobacteria bacterium]